MSGAAKKRPRERFLLEQFFEAANIAAIIQNEEGEAPDFIVEVDGKIIGVELTDLFILDGNHPNNLQASESLADRIIAEACSIYSSFNKPPLHVRVAFRPCANLKAVNRSDVSRAIAGIVVKRIPAPGARFRWYGNRETDSLANLVSSIHITGAHIDGRNRWVAVGAGWVATESQSVLQRRIDEKAALLESYRLRATTNWLLLVTGGTKPSQFIEPPLPQIARATFSPFERTFFFEPFRRIVIELGRPEE